MNIIAIIPAYNEEKTIGKVLGVLKRVRNLDRIIVVSDGSTDNTVEVAHEYGVDVLVLEKNKGKGGAMKAGLDSCVSDIILFLDADLIGLTINHVNSLLKPVIDGEVDMTIGIFDDGRIITDLAQKLVPKLSGQRAIKTAVLEQISGLEISKFGVEVALNDYMKKEKIKIQKVKLKNMSHVTKEEKLGVLKGFNARMKMYAEIINYLLKKNI